MNNFLDLYLDEDSDLSLERSVLMFIFMLEYIYARVVLEEIIDIVENVIFTNFLMGTTI